MTIRTIIITGVDGFVGRHVAATARSRGLRVVGIVRGSLDPADRLHDELDKWVSADLTEGWPDVSGDAVVHLAGLAAVGASFGEPQVYIETGSAIVTHMCESLLRSPKGVTRIVGVSSGAVYASGGDTPLDETSPIAVTSPYVISKLLLESQFAYYASRGLDVVVARPFNHIGPGQGSGFLVPDLIANMRSLSPNAELAVGDLGTARDYTDVRDVARAYLDLLVVPRHDQLIYNVATGTARTGHEILGEIAAAMGLPVPSVAVDRGRIRPGDARRVVGDAARLMRETEWTPRIDFSQSIRDAVAAAI
ncbi:NAD(P)-dependent oxidoreductase [uncultured Microbacterium sp.]|uniref:Nucleoside-diphosphate-sugar epimerase n=1 Tax=uncultured Microbacterium sp. TaxID=191216 RepID=A0A1Y5P550_9MICO|nr:NAD-dependent epimerase/dehydratase family protein [uncultured Microbacterium sp.]SBS71221.1 Nucleoside-diphosphate-sugar epimerase [uncultured Microbacterium sp.]